MKELILIQNAVKVPKDQNNTFGKYKYRTAEGILKAAKPILLEHKATLHLTDSVEFIGGKHFLKATATLTIGECSMAWDGFAEIGARTGMSPEQTTGAASSYARKYALNGMFLIDESEQDPDSDTVAEAAKSEKEKPKPEKMVLLPIINQEQYAAMQEYIYSNKSEYVMQQMAKYQIPLPWKNNLMQLMEKISKGGQ